MYDIPFSKMIQPRVGATWAYNGTDTVFGSYARYNPAASSLPRAASWDRNLIGTFIDNHFDANGVLFAAVPVDSSSGKLFVDDLTPRTIDEYRRRHRAAVRPPAHRRAPTGAIVTPATSGKTRTTTRGLPSTRRPASRASCTSRISADKLAQIGNGSTYVIAELDGAYTKYYEFTARIGMARRQGVRSRLVHLEPLLRQLRPGQLDHGQRRQRLHRLVVHRATAPAASSGTSRTATCAATAGTC